MGSSIGSFLDRLGDFAGSLTTAQIIGIWSVLGFTIFNLFASRLYGNHQVKKMIVFATVCGPIIWLMALTAITIAWLAIQRKEKAIRDEVVRSLMERDL